MKKEKCESLMATHYFSFGLFIERGSCIWLMRSNTIIYVSTDQ